MKIFGLMHDVVADVIVLDGFSAHADQHGLIEFATSVRKHLENVFLVHGEPTAQVALTRALTERGFVGVMTPGPEIAFSL